MKYAVFGPREGRVKEGQSKPQVYDDTRNVAYWLGTLNDIDMVIVGGGKGVETLAYDWAKRNQKEVQLIKPLFDAGAEGTIPVHMAFDRRNMEILRACDAVIVFWEGRFKDLIDLMRTAIAMGKHVLLFPM